MIFKPFTVDYFIPHTFYILRMVFIEVLFRQEEKSVFRLADSTLVPLDTDNEKTVSATDSSSWIASCRNMLARSDALAIFPDFPETIKL
jgi:hypothetical protein